MSSSQSLPPKTALDALVQQGVKAEDVRCTTDPSKHASECEASVYDAATRYLQTREPERIVTLNGITYVRVWDGEIFSVSGMKTVSALVGNEFCVYTFPPTKVSPIERRQIPYLF